MHRSPEDIYRAEKEKARRERTASHDGLMAEAQRAFDQRLEEGRAARKGGRPKKEAARVVPMSDLDEILAPPAPPRAEPVTAPKAEAGERSAPVRSVASPPAKAMTKEAKRAPAKAAAPAKPAAAGKSASRTGGSASKASKAPGRSAKAPAASKAGAGSAKSKPGAAKSGTKGQSGGKKTAISTSARQPAGRGKERKTRR